MLQSSLLPNIPTNGQWSVDTMRLLHPNMNILESSRPQEITKASPSVDEYLGSVLWVKHEPA